MINKPLSLSHSLTLHNRVVVPPMASQTADHLGRVTSETLGHYKRLSQSRAGLVMVEYSFVSIAGRSEPNQLGIDQDDKIKDLRKLSHTIKATGAKSAIQLVHAGGKSARELTDGTLLSPSGIIVPTIKGDLEKPDEASLHQISLLKRSFVKAAIRADHAGFDIIELHAAHGYGLNQWISPITNKRSDHYGGNLLNRSRILLEIVKEILVMLPGKTLSVRIPGQDHFAGGLSPKDSIEIARLLEKAGVSIINVSSGIGGWRRPRTRRGEGYLVEDAELIQKSVDLPVIGVGGITTSDYIERSLTLRRFSLAAVGRAILNDPKWGEDIGLTASV